MKKLVTLAFLIFSLFSYAQAQEIPSKEHAFTITDIKGISYEINGKEEGLDIKGLEGKIVFLEFFGHKCPPCLASIPHLISLQEKYKDSLAIIALEVQGYDNAKLSAFAKEKGINYIAVSEETSGNFVNYISQRAEWNGNIPFLIALDTKGSVQFIQAGMMPEESLEELIRQLTPPTIAETNQTNQTNQAAQTN
ncbi:MAG TPA: thioredoxin [Sulfurovum sp. UBA12169]|nr:MAG TPA: thioredoxin [Sulfurovum sp. UBA12169]